MKKLLLAVPLLFLPLVSASAETIYTHSADEYAAALYEAKHQNTISVMSDFPEASAEERILLLRSDADIDDCGAQYDICDEYGIHTLVYATAGETDAAYEYYIENDLPVCRNIELKIADVTPNSQYFPYLSWGVRYIGADSFMDGLINDYGSVSIMPDVTVAVIDSGIDYEHPRLANRVDKSKGYDYCNNDNDPMDDNHHGTHVAGIIADNTPENVTLIPIKVTDKDGKTYTDQLLLGIKKAIELRVDVINISIASDSQLSSKEISSLKSDFNPLFNEADYRGITICVCAGNCTNNSINANYVFPAFMESAIAVANCRSDGTISSSSNYGSVIDLAAPGTGIYSTYPMSMGSYASSSGTSMAAPFVSASAALLKTMDPDITPSEIDSTLKANLKPFSVSYVKSYGGGILYIGDIYEDDDIPIYDAMTDYEYNGSDIAFTIDNSKNILKSGAVLILRGSVFGSMTRLQTYSISPTQDKEVIVPINGFGKENEFGTIKAYLWQSLSGQKPLSTVYTIKEKN